MNKNSNNWWPNHYIGSQVTTYNVNRKSLKWEREQNFIRDFLAKEADSLCSARILDAPVGTGRFFTFYQMFKIKRIDALDISIEMINFSEKLVSDLKIPVHFTRGSLDDIPFTGKFFDIAICWRFVTWVPFNRVLSILIELKRVTKVKIVISVYFWNDFNLPKRIIYYVKNFKNIVGGKPYIRIYDRYRFYKKIEYLSLEVDNIYEIDVNKSATYAGVVLNVPN
jgi:ubiquinone/menaquinone biosynthesis C-methylase UbiE